MRKTVLMSMTALLAMIIAEVVAIAQSPDPRQPTTRGAFAPNPLSTDDIVARIMFFDKDKKGKVAKADLPERMQFLVDLGDTNKDGALDKEEIKKLATKMTVGPGGPDGRDRIRRGSAITPDGGFGARLGGFGAGPGGFGVSFRGDGNAIEGVVDDLRLTGKKKEEAMAAAKAHHENVRRLIDQARADLLQRMKEILSEEEFADFKAALDRPRGDTTIISPVGPPEGKR